MKAGRLLLDGPAPGAWNMAVDEALLDGLREAGSPPTLRLYAWTHPTLSLGRAQQLAPALAAACTEAGVEVVRRPTGGRAVLHAGDFTYAVTSGDLPAGVRDSYCVLARGLRAGLASLGIAAEMGEGNRPGRSADCFASPTSADLAVAAAKLMGSAQLRREGAVLQHGTLYLDRPAALSRRLFPGEASQVTDLRSVLGRLPGLDELREALAAGLAKALGLEWRPGELTAWERARAEARMQDFRL